MPWRRAAEPTAEGAEGESIAVLPFANLSGDPEFEYFSEGIAEEIINALTQLPGLRVAARTSSFAFRGPAIDLAEVGSKLKVATVLEGSVAQGGEPAAHRRPAREGRRWVPSLVGTLRSRDAGCLRDPGRNREGDREPPPGHPGR